MSDSTKAFVDAWFASIDLKTMMLDHWRRQLDVDDLSEVKMVSEDELWAGHSSGPRCAVGAQGKLIYDAGVKVTRYTFKPRETPPRMLPNDSSP